MDGYQKVGSSNAGTHRKGPLSGIYGAAFLAYADALPPEKAEKAFSGIHKYITNKKDRQFLEIGDLVI